MANGPLVQKAPTVEVLYSSASYIRFQERAWIPKHVFGTIMETIAGEAEKMSVPLSTNSLLPPNLNLAYPVCLKLNCLRGEKCKNPLYSNGS